MTAARLDRILIYARDVDATAAFYANHFGFEVHREAGDRIVELVNPTGGARLMIHQKAKSQKSGQSTVKLVFDAADVAVFCANAAKAGLQFGPLHHGDGYAFANAKDMDGNPISVSSRAFRDTHRS